jgi:CubicO group peptidase (beta-lactamase class C family)
MSSKTYGYTDAKFLKVQEAFEKSFEAKPEMGAALAIYHQGLPVVDIWRGYKNSETRELWDAETLSVIFSCTKGLSSILAARLVQEGKLDYEATVASYWPEFGVAGKSEVTIRDILAHRSGISAPRIPLSSKEITDWNFVVNRLANQEPLWEPGTGYAYHAITHGWLIGEVVRRITGLSLGEYFQSLLALPLGAEAWVGLPSKEQSRVSTMKVGTTLADLIIQQAEARKPGVVDWSEQAMTLGGALEHELVGVDSGFNSAEIRAAEIPGAGGVATARSIAAIWSSTVIETHGHRVLEDATLVEALKVQSEGSPVWPVPGPWPRWGMGFQLDSEARRYLSSKSFGHDGAGGQVAFADAGSGIGFAFLTNQMEAIDDQRATLIIDTLREVLAEAI